MFLGRLDLVPAVHRPAFDAFEVDDVARAAVGQAGEVDVLTDARIDADVQRAVVVARQHAVHVGQRDGAQRTVEHAALGVALEQLADLALAAGDDHQVAGGGVALQLGEARFLDHQLATKRFELGHPARHLDALVDRLARGLHACPPVDQQPLVVSGAQVHAGGGWTAVVPERQPQLTLEFQCHVVHRLAGQHPAGGNLRGGAVGDQGDGVALLEQADAQLQTGLSGANDCYLSHALELHHQICQ
ncbi:hypothetical protein D3C78_808440 [compost metagenome]